MVLMDPWGDTLDEFLWELFRSDWPENLCFEGRWSKPDLPPALQWCCCCDMP